MKKLFYASSISLLFLTAACQSPATKDAVKGQQLAQEAIALHDEIMPQIASFDQTTIKIDSILNALPQLANSSADIDTVALKTDLENLKNNLEQATDGMMTWMYEYVADSTDVAYQQAEVEKVKTMKKQFDDVAAASNKTLSSF